MAKNDRQSVRYWHGLEAHVGDYDLIICDLWGVMHDGLRLSADAVIALENARDAGVQTVFLSNAPRPRSYVRAHLEEMGMSASLAGHVVTSGGLARDAVRAAYEGRKLYHMGPYSDRNTVENLPVEEVSHPDEADVILITDLDFRDRPIEEHRSLLKACAERDVEMLCANPDRIVHVGETLYACAGAVADIYQDMGGKVQWFGKPVANALQSAMREVGVSPETQNLDRVLMIGDSLKTDIAGACNTGVHGLLIGGGIHRAETERLLNDKNLPADKSLPPGASQTTITADAFIEAFNIPDEASDILPHALMSHLRW